jgi:hypothetical protein
MVSTPFANEQYRNQEGKATMKPNCYQKIIICVRSRAALFFVYCAAEGGSIWLQQCNFGTAEKRFSLATAA